MGIDTLVNAWAQTFRFPWGDAFMLNITILGNWLFLFSMSAVLCIALWGFQQKKHALDLFLNVWGGGLVVVVIKYTVQRLRPELGLVEEIGFSFPSAHAFLSLSFYGFLLYLLWNTKIPKCYRWIGSLWLLCLIVLISFSRIYLGVHWFSDVVGGLVLSVGWMWVVGKYTPGKRVHP